MPRRRVVERREPPPDPVYNNVLVSRVINCLMGRGKKSNAERILYGSLQIVEDKLKTDGLSVLKQALTNIKPVLEVKSRRVGGATYQVPVEIRPDRRTALGIRWLISHARSRSEHTMREKLAMEVIAASKGEGAAVKKREDTHKMAEANKAFAHYRW
jgi:small subunit ribosomal protein S7